MDKPIFKNTHTGNTRIPSLAKGGWAGSLDAAPDKSQEVHICEPKNAHWLQELQAKNLTGCSATHDATLTALSPLGINAEPMAVDGGLLEVSVGFPVPAARDKGFDLAPMPDYD